MKKQILKTLKATVIALGGLAAASAAQAHWVASGGTSTFTATVSANGGSFSYAETDGFGPVKPVVDISQNLLIANMALEVGLNARLREQAAANGMTYLGGTVSGDLNITVAPVNGALQATLSGLSFRAATQFSGSKWGVIKYDCTNIATINNIVIRAQYGASNGAVNTPTVGVTGETGSSTECDSNIGWMLPFIGDLLIDYAANKVDAKVVDAIGQLMAKTQGSLLYGSQVNLGLAASSGLTKLIPTNAVVNGFPIGTYVRDNIGYLLANSQITMKLGHGVQLPPWRRQVPPAEWTVFTGDVMNMTLTAPGLSLNLNLQESRTDVEWVWVCNVDDLTKQCPQP